MRALSGAFAFLTVLPLPRRWALEPSGAMLAAFPVVGLALGAALAGADLLAGRLFPDPVRAGLVLGLWLLASGALHLDGWVDLCDALMPGLSPDQARAALKDPRIGAGGLAGGVGLLLLKFAALAALEPPRWTALVMALVLARWAAVLVIDRFPYGGGPSGRGWPIKLSARRLHLAVATALTVPLLLVLPPPLMAAGYLLAAGAGLGLAWASRRRLGGVSGDVYGAAIELGEVSLLLLALAWARLAG